VIEAGRRPREASIEEYHRVLVTVSLALMASVALFVGVAWVLVATERFQPFIGLQPGVRIGVGAFLLALLGASYPLSRAVGGDSPPDTREKALSNVQTRVMVGMAMRDAVGAMAAVLILLAGDVVLGGTLAFLVLLSMGLSLPGREQLDEAARGLPSGG
jgi:hypothetical protein